MDPGIGSVTAMGPSSFLLPASFLDFLILLLIPQLFCLLLSMDNRYSAHVFRLVVDGIGAEFYAVLNREDGRAILLDLSGDFSRSSTGVPVGLPSDSGSGTDFSSFCCLSEAKK